MKRLFLILLTLLLLLSGCAQTQLQDVTENSTGESTDESIEEPAGLYLPDSEIELQTGGGVLAYAMDRNDYIRLIQMRNKLLLVTSGEQARLTALFGRHCEIVASADVSYDFAAETASFQTTSWGMCYYIEGERTVVFLDPDLQQIKSISLPRDARGKALINPQTQEIYYCVGAEIRAYNPDTGLSRLIKKQSCNSQRLCDIYFSGAVISCEVTDMQGQVFVAYISTQTGETLRKDENLLHLQTQGDDYFAIRKDGMIRQQILGQLSGESLARSINVSGENLTFAPAFSIGGMVTYQTLEEGIQLSYYDLTTGKKSSQLTLPGQMKVVSTLSDKDYFWILTATDTAQVLYRWDIKTTPTGDDTAYIGPLFTLTAPDLEGLKACQARVDTLNNKYGLAIRIFEDAVKYNGGYTIQKEYQVDAIHQALDQLEALFSGFPEKFLDKTADGTDSGRMRICIVRSIAEKPSAQFWYDENAFLLLSVNSDIAWEFLQQVGYVADSFILGNSVQLDNWASLNPKDFSYGGTGDYGKYLTGSNRAFVSEIAVKSLIDDRSQIFAYAVSEKGKDCFTSPILQAKLKQLCVAIRDAYNWKKITIDFPWEQYLDESLAYVK